MSGKKKKAKNSLDDRKLKLTCERIKAIRILT